MKNNIEKINQVLAKWNPIGVGEDIASDEYQGYIPIILNSAKNKDNLMNCLKSIAIKMEIGFDPQNKEHLKDIQQVCDEIIKIVKSS